MLGKKNNVIVVDYQIGNVSSVINAIKKLGFNCKLSYHYEDLKSASHIILPGVGSFEQGMDNINKLGLKKIIIDYVLNRKIPFLGICLGMQLLATEGYENNKHTKGLDLIQGKVIKLDSKGFKLPHIGWNNAEFLFETPLNKNIQNKSDFYFVHSWVFECNKKENIVSTTNYGSRFTSTIGQNYIYGTQFHPEKSLEMGLKLLQNFLNINA